MAPNKFRLDFFIFQKTLLFFHVLKCLGVKIIYFLNFNHLIIIWRIFSKWILLLILIVLSKIIELLSIIDLKLIVILGSVIGPLSLYISLQVSLLLKLIDLFQIASFSFKCFFLKMHVWMPEVIEFLIALFLLFTYYIFPSEWHYIA